MASTTPHIPPDPFAYSSGEYGYNPNAVNAEEEAGPAGKAAAGESRALTPAEMETHVNKKKEASKQRVFQLHRELDSLTQQYNKYNPNNFQLRSRMALLHKSLCSRTFY